MDPAPGRLLHVTDRYALAHDAGHTWAGAEGFRFEGHDVEAAVGEVHAMVRGRAERCSWWLTERSTPVDLEERLLAVGLVPEDDDYLHAGMLLTREPPRVEGIEVRQVSTLAEYGEARRLAFDAFASAHQRIPTADELAIQWEHEIDPTYAAWIDGRLASVGRAIFTRVGAYLMGGATAEWARGRGAYRAVVRARWDAAVERGTPALAVGAGSMSRPILDRLGFEQVLQFRRLELLLPTA